MYDVSREMTSCINSGFHCWGGFQEEEEECFFPILELQAIVTEPSASSVPCCYCFHRDLTRNSSLFFPLRCLLTANKNDKRKKRRNNKFKDFWVEKWSDLIQPQNKSGEEEWKYGTCDLSVKGKCWTDNVWKWLCVWDKVGICICERIKKKLMGKKRKPNKENQERSASKGKCVCVKSHRRNECQK